MRLQSALSRRDARHHFSGPEPRQVTAALVTRPSSPAGRNRCLQWMIVGAVVPKLCLMTLNQEPSASIRISLARKTYPAQHPRLARDQHPRGVQILFVTADREPSRQPKQDERQGRDNGRNFNSCFMEYPPWLRFSSKGPASGSCHWNWPVLQLSGRP
jgi:hypothetical protein